MPELPEVETVRRGLERTVVGKTVQSVDVRVLKIFPADRSLIETYLVGATIVSVDRRAKVILVHLSNGWALAIHLKMTGQIIVASSEVVRSQGFTGGHPESAYEAPLPHKHTHVIIELTDGTTLYFNDLRKFGWLRLFPRSMKQEVRSMGPTLHQFLESLNHGPEPFGDEFTAEYLWRQAKKRAIPVKTFLLDQKVVAGVGNIYADEALFEARIRPTRKARSLSKVETERLHAALRHVLQLGIEHGGTTLNTYRTVEGTAGKMRERLQVYGRAGQPCAVCGTPIERVKIGQRSSHWCPTCQR